MPKGKRIGYIRADAASYQAEIFNYCEERRIKYAIGAHIDKAYQPRLSGEEEINLKERYKRDKSNRYQS